MAPKTNSLLLTVLFATLFMESCGVIWNTTASSSGNGGGAGGATVPTVSKEYVYTCNQNATVPLNGFSEDFSTGILTSLGAMPTDAGTVGFGCISAKIITGTSLKFLLLDATLNQILYVINPSTGSLSLAPGGSPITPAIDGRTSGMDATGRFLIGADDATDQLAKSFKIDPTTGTITAASSVAIPGGHVAALSVITSDGKFAYFIDPGAAAGGVSQAVIPYSINQSTGALTYLGSTYTFACTLTNFSQVFAQVDPSNGHLFVSCNHTGSKIYSWAIGGGGLLTAPATPSLSVAGTDSDQLYFSKTGTYGYVNVGGTFGEWGFQIATDGTLTLLNSGVKLLPTLVTGDVHISPDGNYFTAGGGGSVSLIKINADGTLAIVAGSPFSCGSCSSTDYYSFFDPLQTTIRVVSAIASSNIAGMAFNSSTGVATALPSYPSVGDYAWGVVFATY